MELKSLPVWRVYLRPDATAIEQQRTMAMLAKITPDIYGIAFAGHETHDLDIMEQLGIFKKLTS